MTGVQTCALPIYSSSDGMQSLLKQSKTALKYADTSNSINGFINKTNNRNEIITAQANDFVSGISELTKGLTSKLNHDDDKILISLISSYNSLLGNQVSRITGGKPVLTTWENLGTISKNLVQNISRSYQEGETNDLEFYALQLKSPKEFVEKYFESNTQNNEWREFINFNIINNHVNRYFAVIDDSVGNKIKENLIRSLSTSENNNTKDISDVFIEKIGRASCRERV